MSRICPLFSSSSGNSTFIATPAGGILIDAGASAKRISEALASAGATIGDIKAIAVTHTHTDHTGGLKVMLKKTGAELLATAETLSTLEAGELVPTGIKETVIGKETLDISGIGISGFSTSHDCPGSCGYVIALPDGKRVAVCTDLGTVTDEVHNAISGCDAVLLESNHDVEMLKRGPYPPLLKMRILSDNGHLSNPSCAAEAVRLFKNGTNKFILGHLSQQNNTPLLASSATEAALFDIGAKNGRDYLLTVAKPNGNGVTVI